MEELEGGDRKAWRDKMPPCGRGLLAGRVWWAGWRGGGTLVLDVSGLWAERAACRAQCAARSVGKVESGSQFYCPRHSGPHPASWPSSRPTLSKMTVFLNTTTSSARTFSSELKQGTRERSGVGELGSEWNCCWMRQHRGQVLSTLLLGDHRPQVSWGSGRMG